tara:strand:- start:160 stop:411 length:252 start_codon:yes stop_codon:yes gene_type:complete
MNEPTEKMIYYYMALFVIKHKYNYKRFTNSIGESTGRLSSLKFTMYEILKFVDYVEDQEGNYTTVGYIEEVIDSELNYILNYE